MPSSICSAMSEISISLNGVEQSLEQAIDDTFKELQQNLNFCQTNLRNLAQCEERGDEFEISHDICSKINSNILEMKELFLDLHSIVKQIKLKPETPEEKQWMENYNEEKKREKEEDKKIKKEDKEKMKINK